MILKKLLKCVIEYLSGYEVGVDISKYIEEVYDEDGNINDGWLDATPIFNHNDDELLLIKKHIKLLKECNEDD